MKGKNLVVSLAVVAIVWPVAEILLINIQPPSASIFEGKIETIISSKKEEKPCNGEGGHIVCPP